MYRQHRAVSTALSKRIEIQHRSAVDPQSSV